MNQAIEGYEDLTRRGYCILSEIIPASEVPAMRESAAASIREHTSLPLPNGYVTGFLRVNQDIARYMAHPRIMELVDACFGQNARISAVTGTINGPGVGRGVVHADWPYNQNHQARIESPYPDVVVTLVSMWMLTDYTPENGATIIVPGSHKESISPSKKTQLDPEAIYDGEVQLLGKAGDVGIFDARSWHASAANTTQEDRIGFIVRYSPWWLNLNTQRPGSRERKQIVEDHNGSDSQVDAVPSSVYQSLPPTVQSLVYHMVGD